MSKITWQQLGLIFEGQFGVTAEEASKIISKEIFSHNWKHGVGGKAGRMWHDEVVVANFTQVLEEEDKLAKKVGRKKASKELFFNSSKFNLFLIIASLKYKRTDAGFKTFKNDYAKWKRLSVFKNVWKRGSITLNKLRKRTASKVKKYEKILGSESVSREIGRKKRKQLIDSGDFEEVKDAYGNINLRRIQK